MQLSFGGAFFSEGLGLKVERLRDQGLGSCLSTPPSTV